MNPQPPTSTDPSQADSGRTPSPRAFAIGTGVAFQTVGGVLVIIAIVAGIISVWVVPKASAPLSNWIDFFGKEHLPSALMTIATLNTLIGGLAMMAAGVGLQGERRSSGRVAMLVSGLMISCYFVIIITYIVATGRILPALIVFLLYLVTTIMFALARVSATELRKFPPPPDLNAATPEILEEFRQKRLERLKHYEP